MIPYGREPDACAALAQGLADRLDITIRAYHALPHYATDGTRRFAVFGAEGTPERLTQAPENAYAPSSAPWPYPEPTFHEPGSMEVGAADDDDDEFDTGDPVVFEAAIEVPEQPIATPALEVFAEPRAAGSLSEASLPEGSLSANPLSAGPPSVTVDAEGFMRPVGRWSIASPHKGVRTTAAEFQEAAQSHDMASFDDLASSRDAAFAEDAASAQVAAAEDGLAAASVYEESGPAAYAAAGVPAAFDTMTSTVLPQARAATRAVPMNGEVRTVPSREPWADGTEGTGAGPAAAWDLGERPAVAWPPQEAAPIRESLPIPESAPTATALDPITSDLITLDPIAPDLVTPPAAPTSPPPRVPMPQAPDEDALRSPSRPPAEASAPPAPPAPAVDVAPDASVAALAPLGVPVVPVPASPEGDGSAVARHPQSVDYDRLWLADRSSTPEERQAFRTSLGWRYDAAARSVARLLAEHPGLRSGVTDEALMTELAAVRVFVARDQAELVESIRRGDPGEGVLAVCAAGGLRRLPSFQGVVVRGGPAEESAADAYLPGGETGLDLIEAAPLIALDDLGAAVPGGVELLIWSATARRLSGFAEGRSAEVAFLPGTRFRVLAVGPPTAGPPVAATRDAGTSRRVLLTEVPPARMGPGQEKWAARILARLEEAAAGRTVPPPAESDDRFAPLPGDPARSMP